MRSRLEAKFARSLDRAGVRWVYEKDCFASEAGEYLPDFRLQIPYFPHAQDQPTRAYIEVKPVSSALAGLSKWEAIIRDSRPDDRLIGWAEDHPMRFAATDGGEPQVVSCCDCEAVALVCGCCWSGSDAGRCACGRGHRHPILFVFLAGEPLDDRGPALGAFRRQT